jgi:hypothetical protein
MELSNSVPVIVNGAADAADEAVEVSTATAAAAAPSTAAIVEADKENQHAANKPPQLRDRKTAQLVPPSTADDSEVGMAGAPRGPTARAAIDGASVPRSRNMVRFSSFDSCNGLRAHLNGNIVPPLPC